jgi:hypothetical protein
MSKNRFYPLHFGQVKRVWGYFICPIFLMYVNMITLPRVTNQIHDDAYTCKPKMMTLFTITKKQNKKLTINLHEA